MSAFSDVMKGRTKEFGLRVARMVQALPPSTATKVLGVQVLRSAMSVGANYREAHRGRSEAEFFAKIGDCLREADETLYWLEQIRDLHLLRPHKFDLLIREANELVAILVTIRKRRTPQSKRAISPTQPQ
ncbi:MAG TPA: four helix bundle protein [Chthoniobacteraceae bacterium]|nr:four helix bundle protein [Chthoniobacteraceae bacterium]